jgi:hypothetical protein
MFRAGGEPAHFNRLQERFGRASTFFSPSNPKEVRPEWLMPALDPLQKQQPNPRMGGSAKLFSLLR